jgi:hypothetical protein
MSQCKMGMEHLDLTPIACTLLRDLGLSDTHIEVVENGFC